MKLSEYVCCAQPALTERKSKGGIFFALAKKVIIHPLIQLNILLMLFKPAQG